MNIVDSSGWLEYFADGPNAGQFAIPLANMIELLVPSITATKLIQSVQVKAKMEHGYQGNFPNLPL